MLGADLHEFPGEWQCGLVEAGGARDQCPRGEQSAVEIGLLPAGGVPVRFEAGPRLPQVPEPVMGGELGVVESFEQVRICGFLLPGPLQFGELLPRIRQRFDAHRADPGSQALSGARDPLVLPPRMGEQRLLVLELGTTGFEQAAVHGVPIPLRFGERSRRLSLLALGPCVRRLSPVELLLRELDDPFVRHRIECFCECSDPSAVATRRLPPVEEFSDRVEDVQLAAGLDHTAVRL